MSLSKKARNRRMVRATFLAIGTSLLLIFGLRVSAVAENLKTDSGKESCVKQDAWYLSGPCPASTSIPFQRVQNNICIEADLNNGLAANFLVDTGCTMSAIDEAGIKQLKLEVTTMRSDDGSSIEIIKVPVLQIGQMQLKDVPLRVRNLSALHVPKGRKLLGIVGESILSKFKVTFDFKHQLIFFDDAHLDRAKSQLGIIKARHYEDGSGIIFDALIDDRIKVPCLFDTGATVNFVPDKLVQALLTKPLVATGEIGGLSGERVKTAETTFRSFRAGNFVNQNPVFLVKLLTRKKRCDPGCVLENDSFATVGPQLWGKSIVTIDYKNMEIQIEEPQR